MGSRSKKDDIFSAIEDFHRFCVFTPTRIIKLESETNLDDGSELGVGHSMSSMFLKNMEILESLNHDPITVLFNTEGGDVVQGLAIYDRIQASPCHITVKVIGCAMSMGSVILQAADDRVMSPNSSLMFHDGSSYAGGNSYETRNMAEFNLVLTKRADNILFNKINEKRDKDNQAHMSRRTFDEKSLKSEWLFAEEVVKIGLADRVEYPQTRSKGNK